MDKNLAKWRRIVEGDPSNRAAHIQHAQAYFRLKGEAFHDFQLWTQLDPLLALSLAHVLGRQLGGAYDVLRVESHSSRNGTFQRAIFRHIQSKIELAFLPGGRSEFLAGNPKLNCPVLIGTIPVNFNQWITLTKRQCHENLRHLESARGLAGFVSNVTWIHIQSWLEKAGAGLRLPSEAEWQYNDALSRHYQISMTDEVQAQWIASLPNPNYDQVPAPPWEYIEDCSGRNKDWIKTTAGPVRIGAPLRRLQVELRPFNGAASEIGSASTRVCDPHYEGHNVGFRVATSLSKLRWIDMLRDTHVVTLNESPLNNGERWKELATLQESIAKQVAKGLGADFQFSRFQSYQCEKKWRIATILHEPTNIEFQLIPGGEFQYGVTNLDEEMKYCKSIDPTLKTSVLERQLSASTRRVAPFLLARTPLTQEQWFRGLLLPPELDDLNKHDRRKWKGLQLPVVGISGLGIDFWLKRILKSRMRLPTELEWEYACRSATTTRYFWGEELSDDYCWHRGNSQRRIHDVTEHEDKTNGFGLIDMLGNVFERCSDNINGQSVSWQDFSTQRGQVSRGGSWAHDGIGCRMVHRRPESRITRHNFVGVRFAISLPSLITDFLDKCEALRISPGSA